MRYLIEFLNNPAKTYYPGNIILCRLNIILQQEKLIKDLRIVFEGRAKVKFRQGRTKIKAKQRFYGDIIGISAELVLQPGQHTFLFQTQLPNDLPPTFNGKYGFIEYKIYVFTKKSKVNGIFPFSVVSFPLQANLDEVIPLTITVGKEKKVYFPKQSIIRGSVITVEIKSSELKKEKEKNISVNLMKYFSYEVSGACSNYRKMEKFRVMKVPITTTNDYNGSFHIPMNVPKTLNFDPLELIKIRYVLKVYVNKQKFKFPIVIN
ncbi:hypothetical protein ACFFRR_003114 [Megaselia abdita]